MPFIRLSDRRMQVALPFGVGRKRPFVEYCVVRRPPGRVRDRVQRDCVEFGVRERCDRAVAGDERVEESRQCWRSRFATQVPCGKCDILRCPARAGLVGIECFDVISGEAYVVELEVPRASSLVDDLARPGLRAVARSP